MNNKDKKQLGEVIDEYMVRKLWIDIYSQSRKTSSHDNAVKAAENVVKDYRKTFHNKNNMPSKTK